MDKLEITQGSFIQQTQYFIPMEIDLSIIPSSNNKTLNARLLARVRTRMTPERTRKNYRISI
jgi:hypothetical protein